MIRAVSEGDLAAVRAFLEAHVDTSLFLLGNLAALGPRLGDSPFSGNYKLIEAGGHIIAVFCLTRIGNVLVQAAGRADLAPGILAACQDEPIEIRGAIGDWPTAEALWRGLLADPGFVPQHSEKEVLYELAPLPVDADCRPPPGISLRALLPEDFAAWVVLNTAHFDELDLPVDSSHEERQRAFVARAGARLWWGAFEGSSLLAIAGLNATYGVLGQVGGVYTMPGHRRRGLARATMALLIRECDYVHRLVRLILFTGETNVGSRRLYESLGFTEVGAFGLLLGTRRTLSG